MCTVAAALVCGSAAGWLVSTVDVAGHRLSTEQLFDDGALWEVHPAARESSSLRKRLAQALGCRNVSARYCKPSTVAEAKLRHACEPALTPLNSTSSRSCIISTLAAPSPPLRAFWCVSKSRWASHLPSCFGRVGGVSQDVDMEALPRGWDGGSVAGSVYRGGARSWAEGSLRGAFALTAFPTGTSAHNAQNFGRPRGAASPGNSLQCAHGKTKRPCAPSPGRCLVPPLHSKFCCTAFNDRLK